MPDQPAERASETSHEGKHDFAEFVHELRRRRVIRVALVYLIAAWLIMQVAQTTFPALLLPDWSVTLVVILLVLGFPIALILSWAFQIEPDSGGHTATSVQIIIDKNRKVDFIVIAGLAGLVVILAYELYVNDPLRDSRVVADATTTEVSPRRAETARPSIGVLPFINLSDDPQNEYFADGLAEEILNLLVRMRELNVASRTSSFYFKDKDVDINMVADQLGVTNVLEGSVKRQGDTIRVTAQLIEVESGFHLWSSTYERDMEDVFGIQDDIARQVALGLNVVLSSDSDVLLDRIPTDSVEGYQFYLQGRDYLRGERSETQLQSAKTLFDRAIENDASYSAAYAGLCDSLLALYELSRSTDYFEQAERACNHGLTLDPGDGDIHVSLGNLYKFSGQPEEAIKQFERAIGLNASNVDAFVGLAETYLRQDRLGEAEAIYQQAIDLQPGFWRGHLEMGHFLFSTGRLEEAVDSFSYVVSVTPDNATGYLNLGTSYYMLGEYENAAVAWQESIELEPRTSTYLNLGSSYFFLHRFDEAAAMYRQASELAPDDFEVWGSLGDAYYYTYDNESRATDAYEKAIELGQKLLDINASDALTMAMLAHYYAKTGVEGAADDMLAQAVDLEPRNMYVHYFAAVTNVSLGEEEQATESIRKAVEFGYPRELVELDVGLTPIVDDGLRSELLQYEN